MFVFVKSNANMKMSLMLKENLYGISELLFEKGKKHFTDLIYEVIKLKVEPNGGD